MSQIIYTYKNCNKEDFNHEINFQEEEFTKILNRVIETKLNIIRITVEFEMVSHPEHKKLVVHVYVDSPDFEFVGKEEGYEYAEVAKIALKKLLEKARDVKDSKIK